VEDAGAEADESNREGEGGNGEDRLEGAAAGVERHR
jgi:hypothetical protein